MNFKTTVHLFVAVCLLAVVVWYVERQSQSEQDKGGLSDHLYKTRANDVAGLTIENGDLRISCLRKQKDEWFIESPLSARADSGQIDRILGIVEMVRKEEVITASQRKVRGLTLEDYGLIKPRARLVVRSRLGEEEDVVIGCDMPLGELISAMYAGTEDVFEVHRSLLNILPSKMEDLRDRTLLHGNTAITTKLEIQRPESGFIQLVRDNGEWMIRQPITARANNALVAQLLDNIYSLTVLKFAWDPVVKQPERTGVAEEIPADSDAKVGVHGFAPDEAAAVVTVWSSGDDIGKQLILGKGLATDTKEMYAKLRDFESIYTVSTNIMQAFPVAIADLRDRNIFVEQAGRLRFLNFEKGDKRLDLVYRDDVGWTIVDPVQWRADNKTVKEITERIVAIKAQHYIDGSKTNLVEMGFDPCSYSIGISDSVPSSHDPEKKDKVLPKAQRRLLVGGSSRDGAVVYVKYSDSQEVMAVSPQELGDIGLNPVDPLIYRDRMMLAVPSDKIIRIALARGGVEQAVVRNPDGGWSVFQSPKTNNVPSEIVCDIIPGALNDVLFNVANMRAVRIEEHNPQNLSKYGLDNPAETVTLGLSKEEGIQKTILLGRSSDNSGRYAMVQGQDVVFVLDNRIVGHITKDLVKKLVSEKPEVNETKE